MEGPLIYVDQVKCTLVKTT